MTPLTGQILNTGHLMQPTANATGQSVMITLPSKSAAACTPPSVAMVLPAHQTGSHFTTPPGLSLRPRLPVNRYVLGSDYPDMKKNPMVH